MIWGSYGAIYLEFRIWKAKWRPNEAPKSALESSRSVDLDRAISSLDAISNPWDIAILVLTSHGVGG